jgi:hypothetical protein
MKRVSCCKKYCHAECLQKWIKVLTCKDKYSILTCPYCRRVLKQQKSQPFKPLELHNMPFTFYSLFEKERNYEEEEEESDEEEELILEIGE